MKNTKCWVCETPVEGNEYVINYCDKCKEEKIAIGKEVHKKYLEAKNAMRMENVEQRILSCHSRKEGMLNYKEAIEQMKEYLKENPTKFGSTEEMLAATIFIHNRLPVKPQYKIANKRIDFLIPSLKIALEIDGPQHKNFTLKDTKRDLEILFNLGKEWDVIRIEIKHINRHPTSIIKAIQALKEEKKTFKTLYKEDYVEAIAKVMEAKQRELENEIKMASIGVVLPNKANREKIQNLTKEIQRIKEVLEE